MFMTVTQRLLEAFELNILLFFGTLAASLPLGLLVAFGSMSNFRPLHWLEIPFARCRIKPVRLLARPLAEFRPIRIVSRTFVWIIRGTPLLLQILVIFYGPGLLWDWDSFGRVQAALIAFIINYSAYFSEIFRGGIESISKGQYEAGQVLGMTKIQVFFKIILLQVTKRILPPMSNEVINLVKDTSLARVIAIKEIIMMGQEYISSAALIWPLFYTGIFFLAFNGILTLVFGFIEKKLSYFRV